MFKKIGFITLLLVALGVGLNFVGGSKKMEVLKVGYPEYWGKNMSPSLQHTIYADALMGNQFEALVSIGPAGSIKALAAKSWTVSDDKKTYTFKIDTSRKFSDGTPLTSKVFKDSWEYGLSLPPKSANSSLQDILYKVVGYESFSEKKEISGLKTPDDETFIIEFKDSFRAALTNLAGSRMAAFIIDENKNILGTGPYIINESEDRKLTLTVNPYREEGVHFKKVLVEVIDPNHAQESLESGKIDVFSLAEHAEFSKCLEEDTKTGCFSGNESRHITMVLNSKPGRLFNKLENRLAIQALFYDTFAGKTLPTKMKLKTVLDPQIFLPLQSGRIEDKIAMEMVERGRPFIESFIEETKSKPIRMITGTSSNLIDWVKKDLMEKGVHFSEESEVVPMKELAKTYYKTHDTDISLMTLSVASGDPDGIYHVLGRNGSIASPMMFRRDSSKLLEEGRKILDLGQIDGHYQKVTEAALLEVPFVHIGYLKTLMAYRKDKLKLNKAYKQREDYRFSEIAPL